MQCSVSSTGEKVCETKNSLDQNEDTNGSSIDNANWDDALDESDDFDDDDFEDEVDESCKDTHELCSSWASLGECTKNPDYMLKGCPKSCNSCPDVLMNGLTQEQQQEKGSILSTIAEYGEQQEVDGDKQHETMFVIKKTIDYMKNFIYAEHPTHQLSEDVIKVCRNDYTLCSFWAAFGECENNAGFMVTKCAPVCLSCHKINYNERYVQVLI